MICGKSYIYLYGDKGKNMAENKRVQELINHCEKVIIGKRDALELSMITLLSEGHLLLEDVPGVGKTTLANTLAKTIGCGFSRIQFTPDTLPGDVLGVNVYHMQRGTFEYIKGAIMNQIILADEINRTSPKTQASLLEAMEERQVTVDGTTYPLPRPFMVIATQNPVDYLGTYHLPEAQLDRFFMKISLGYPSNEDEKNLVGHFLGDLEWKKIQAIASETDICEMQDNVKKITVHTDIISYILSIIEQTRNNEYITLGASPRATLAVVRGAQATAYLANRDYVTPDDVKRVLKPILKHRLVLSPEARVGQMSGDKILSSILTKVRVPVC